MEVNGAVVDVRGLLQTAEDSKRKLAQESGSRACAEVLPLESLPRSVLHS